MFVGPTRFGARVPLQPVAPSAIDSRRHRRRSSRGPACAPLAPRACGSSGSRATSGSRGSSGSRGPSWSRWATWPCPTTRPPRSTPPAAASSPYAQRMFRLVLLLSEGCISMSTTRHRISAEHRVFISRGIILQDHGIIAICALGVLVRRTHGWVRVTCPSILLFPRRVTGHPPRLFPLARSRFLLVGFLAPHRPSTTCLFGERRGVIHRPIGFNGSKDPGIVTLRRAG